MSDHDTPARCVAIFALLAIGGWQPTAVAGSPNVVLIVADDVGWNDVGYHNPEMRTPHIDRLAGEGVRFGQHYVMPQCTPTRVALMTGRYPCRFGEHCTRASNEQSYPLGTPTMASLLAAAGYHTAMAGKWHMGSTPEAGPNHFGFASSYGSLTGAVGMYDHRYRLSSPFVVTWHRDHEFVTEVGHATDLVAEEAERVIADAGERPFFLYLPFHAAHTPLVEPPEYLDRNRHHKSTDRMLYAASVSHLDDAVGRVVAALEKARLRENTLIVFTSDNGAQVHHKGGAYPPPDPSLRSFSSNAPLRSSKTHVYEGGIRVPAFANWPGKLDAVVCDAPLHAVDWLPTFGPARRLRAPRARLARRRRHLARRHGRWRSLRRADRADPLLGVGRSPPRRAAGRPVEAAPRRPEGRVGVIRR